MARLKHASDSETTQEPTAYLRDDQPRLGQPVRVMQERGLVWLRQPQKCALRVVGPPRRRPSVGMWMA